MSGGEGCLVELRELLNWRKRLGRDSLGWEKGRRRFNRYGVGGGVVGGAGESREGRHPEDLDPGSCGWRNPNRGGERMTNTAEERGQEDGEI